MFSGHWSNASRDIVFNMFITMDYYIRFEKIAKNTLFNFLVLQDRHQLEINT